MMHLEDILLEETLTIRNAIEKLEEIRCKVVYVVNNNKLKGSVSDGDIRRFSLKNGNIENCVTEISNKYPKFFYENQKKELKDFFQNCDAWSAPIINYNYEVVGVAFRNGTVIKRTNLIECPVIIMAGGKGTRLYPYTRILPKALIPIGDMPIAERIIRSFQNNGCSQFYMIVNHKKKMIKAYFEGCENKYNIEFFEENVPLGTGGGLCMVKGKMDKDFFFTNCDILIDADYSSMYQEHKKQDNTITVIAAHYKNEIPYGVIEIDDNGQYMEMKEKPSVDYVINTGLYIMKPEVLEVIPENVSLSFPDIIEMVRRKNKKIGVYVVDETAYMDMGQLEELKKMQKRLDIE